MKKVNDYDLKLKKQIDEDFKTLMFYKERENWKVVILFLGSLLDVVNELENELEEGKE